MSIILFYDVEVFKYDWLMVIGDLNNKSFHTFKNDVKGISKFFENHKNDIWVGFNNKNYDQYIMKAILTGHSPYKVSRYIINEHKAGFNYSSDFRTVRFQNYDIYNTLTHSLKFYEGSMGDSIEESSIPFDIDRKLTTNELDEVEIYCRHDVEETIKVFFKKKDDFLAQLGLIKIANNQNLIQRTQTQIASVILNADSINDLESRQKDQFDISIPETLKLSKYEYVKDWYLNDENMNYEKSLETTVFNVPHIFAFGGLHGAIEKYHYKGNILLLDVASLYPSLMISYDLLSRAVANKNVYKELRDKRLKYKKEKNPLQLPLKLVLNKTYGAMKDRNNSLYDPLNANNVCIYGQLLILDLIEHLEMLSPYVKLIQTNTDGIFISYDDGYLEKIREIYKEWESRTKLELEETMGVELWQKDVNNYLLILSDGQVKSKGAYVKKLDSLDYGDYPIINKAIVEKLVHNTPISETINNCDDLIDFQMVCKITGKFSKIYYGNKPLNEKCVRIFAGDNLYPSISKQHAETLSLYKIPNTPEHVFIDNSDIHGKKVDYRLNKKFYIDLANKRLSEFL